MISNALFLYHDILSMSQIEFFFISITLLQRVGIPQFGVDDPPAIGQQACWRTPPPKKDTHSSVTRNKHNVQFSLKSDIGMLVIWGRGDALKRHVTIMQVTKAYHMMPLPASRIFPFPPHQHF